MEGRMLIDTNNLVTVEEFRKELKKYIASMKKGEGPIAVLEDSKVVGYFIRADEYEAMHEEEIQELLRSREGSPKLSHEVARARALGSLKKKSRKP